MAKADANVSVNFEGDDDKLVRTLGRLEKKLGAVTQDLRKVKKQGEAAGEGVGKKMKGAGKEAVGAFGPGAVRQMKSFATSVIGIGGAAGVALGALRLITAELRSQKDLQASAAGAQITVSGARQELIRNLGGMSPKQIRGVLASGVSISQATGVSQVPIFQALAQGVSASGGDTAGALSSVRLAAKFLADAPESIAPFAGSLLDLSKVTGSRDPRLNLGFTQFVGQASRVVDPALQAKNIPPALIGAQPFGTSAATGAALFAALTNATADIRGAVSGTALINLSSQLEAFLPEMSTTIGRIRALQASPEEAREFLTNATFEQKAKGPIRSLFTDPSSVIARQLNKNLASIPDERGLVRLADQALANRRADPLERTASLARSLDVAIEQAQTSDPVNATGAVIRSRFKELLKRTGVGALESSVLLAEFELRSRVGTRDPFETFTDILEEREARLRTPRKIPQISPGSTFPGQTFKDFPASEENLESADRLEEVINRLDTIARNTTGPRTLLGPDQDK